MVAPASPKWKDYYWDNTKEITFLDVIYRTGVVAFHALIAVAAVGLFLYNPPLFAPIFFLGMLLRDPLDTAFDHVSKVFKMAPILCCIILFLGAILAFPSSAWIACGLVALWAGKRVVDLGMMYTD